MYFYYDENDSYMIEIFLNDWIESESIAICLLIHSFVRSFLM